MSPQNNQVPKPMHSKIHKLESKRAQIKFLQKEGQPLTFTHPRQLSLVQFTEQMEGRKLYTQPNGILMFPNAQREVLHTWDSAGHTPTDTDTIHSKWDATAQTYYCRIVKLAENMSDAPS